MVIPAVALLIKAEDLPASKSTDRDSKQLKKNIRHLNVVHLSATQTTVKDNSGKDESYKAGCSPRFDGRSYFSSIPLFTKP
ncbi:hypothetical protein DBR40_11615 [Pedobacter sp. KBW01]|nr:hypothetical protein DBR40_11615 [Pedobacter sp. KBW01]